MGNARPRPKRLAEKLLALRSTIDGGLSQTEMAQRLGLNTEDRERISKYERDVLEPPLEILCVYADVANVWLEVLVKDNLDLPEKLPSKIKSAGLRK